MTDTDRIKQLEAALRSCWGVLLIADEIMSREPSAADRRYIRAAFAKVDQECRRTKLLAREGMVFIEAPEVVVDLPLDATRRSRAPLTAAPSW